MRQSPLQRNRLKCILDILLGILYLTSTLIGYLPAFSAGAHIHFAEWCCITGIFGGIFYLASAVFEIRSKTISEILHFNITLILILIFIATVAVRLELEGAFWFIHLFGPLLVLMRFFLFCDCTKIKTPYYVFTSIAFPIGYILFSICLLQATGKCPFPAKLILVQRSPCTAMAMSAGLCALILLLAFGLFYLNRIIRKKRGHI